MVDAEDARYAGPWKPVSIQTLTITAVLKYGPPKGSPVSTWVLALFPAGTSTGNRPDQEEVWRNRPKNPSRTNLSDWLSNFLAEEEASDLVARFAAGYPGFLEDG